MTSSPPLVGGRAMSLADRVAEGARILEAAGMGDVDSVRDATLLARRLLGWDAADWIVRQVQSASSNFDEAFAAVIARRAAGEPVAYLVGEREFYGRTFAVTGSVLIPRPETELVVDEALAVLAAPDGPASPDVTDVGTGSGCLAITLALEHPRARIVATDISAAALNVAALNASAFGVADRIDFQQTSLLGPRPTALDLIVSNPPYIVERDRGALPRDVRDFEPAIALFGGADGLDVIRELVAAAAISLRPAGTLVMEIGMGQAAAVRHIIRNVGSLDVLHIAADLAGIPRVVVARKSI